MTLVTGQTVHVTERNGTRQYRVSGDQPVQTVRTPQGTYVLPTGVDYSRFDMDLFNVDLLLSQGLDDANTSSLPVIVETEPVEFRPGQTSTGDVLASTSAVTTTETLSTPSMQSATVAKDGAGAAYTDLASADSVERVSLDVRYDLALDEAANRTNAASARQQFDVSGEGVRVAVLDTGINESHPDIDQVALEKNFTAASEEDPDGHGTHVAGIIAGDGTSNSSYVGMAPNVTLLDGRVCDTGCPSSAIISGIKWATDNDADVISISIGGPNYQVRSNDIYRDAVQYAVNNGTMVVISAGNDGRVGYGTVGSPGTLDDAFTVGSTDKTGNLSAFSSLGPTNGGFFLKPDVVAPGSNVMSANTNWKSEADYHSLSGTSMSTPVVSGIAALVEENNANYSVERLRSVIGSTADPLDPADHDNVYGQGTGLVNATDAVDPGAVVTPSTVDFGAYSENTTVTRTVTVTNFGDQSETFNVTASATGVRTGTDANASVWTNVSNPLTLGPNESADIELTVDTSLPADLYSGRLSLDDNEYTAAFGFVRAYNVTVEKQGLGGSNVTGDALWLFTNESHQLQHRFQMGLTTLTSDSHSYGIVEPGEYNLMTTGVDEDTGQPIVVVREVTIDGSTTITLDEANTTTLSLNTSAIPDADKPLVKRMIHVEAVKKAPLYYGTSGYSRSWATYGYPMSITGVSGSDSVPGPDTTTVRVSTNDDVNVTVDHLLYPDSGAGNETLDVPRVYRLLNQVQGISGPVEFDVNLTRLHEQEFRYRRTESTRNFTIEHQAEYEAGYFTSNVVHSGDVGDRLRQTFYLSPLLEQYHVTVSESGDGNWTLERSLYPRESDYTHAGLVNEHPYTTRFYPDIDGGELEVWARTQLGGSLLRYNDTAADNMTISVDGSTVWTAEEPASDFSTAVPIGPGDPYEISIVARNEQMTQSTKTVASVSATNQSDTTPPEIPDIWFGNQTPNSTVGAGTIEVLAHAYDIGGESNVTEVRIFLANDSVDTVPFTENGINPNGEWVEASPDTKWTDYIYSANFTAEAGTRLGSKGPIHVAVRAETDNGSVAKTTVFNATVVTDTPPTADFFTVPRYDDSPTVQVGQPIEFNGTSSSDNFGLDDFQWSVNGTSYSARTVEHTFDELGEYTASLTVTDSAGQTDTVTKTVTVVDRKAPSVSVTVNRSQAELNVTTVDFDASNTTDEYGIAYYEWDYDGDGTYEANTTAATTTHVFETTGNLTPVVRVVDDAGNARTVDLATIDVSDTRAPAAAVFANRTTVNVSGSVQVDAANSTDEGGIVSYTWNVTGEDGDTEGVSQVVTFDTLGTHTVAVTAVDAAGNEGTDAVDVTVVDQIDPTATLGVSDTTPEVNATTVAFDAGGASDNHEIVYYEWDVDGDGTVEANTTDATTTYTYETLGAMTPTVTVTDPSGNNATASTSLTVEDTTAPTTSLTANATTLELGDATVALDASGTTDNDEVATFHWDVDGDGTVESTTSSPTTTHTYTALGTHTVEVTAEDASGNNASATLDVTVEDTTAPAAALTANRTDVTLSDATVAFDATKTTDAGTIVSILWDWDGDGTAEANTTDATQNHTFTAPANRTVTVTAVDASGNEDTATLRVNVTDAVAPTAALSVSPNGSATDLKATDTVEFNASNATDNDQLAEFRWDWDGDGSVDATTTNATVNRTPPVDGTYTVTVTVVDRGGNTDQATTTLNVSNSLPVADAGANQTVTEGDTVTLLGNNSDDPDNDTLQYNWTRTAGLNVTLSDRNVSMPTFTAPSVSSAETVTFRLDVTDDDPTLATDTVTVTVEPEQTNTGGGGAGGGGGVGQGDGPAGTVKISDWSLSESTVAPGEQVTMTVTVSNTADETKTITPALYVDGDLVEGKRLAVLQGTERTVQFTYRFEETGTHRVSPDTIESRTVTVAKNGGATTTSHSTTTATTDDQPPTTTAAADPSETTTTAAGATPTASGGDGEDDSDAIPGFGPVAALLAVVFTVVLARRRA